MTLKFPKTDHLDFTRNMVKRHRLVPHLERFFTTEVTDFKFEMEPKEKDDAWHPSGHCTPAPSTLFDYAMVDHKQEREWGASMLKTFAVGHFWHQLLQHAVLALGFAEPGYIERRGFKGWGNTRGPDEGRMLKSGRVVPWDAWHWATGAGDVAPLVLPDWQGVVDFKTMSTHQFKPLAKGGGLPEWCREKYEAQINIYMDFFDEERALIVAVQKDSPHEMTEIEFARNQPLIDAIYDKWEFVSECLDAGEFPDDSDDDGNLLADLAFDFTDLYTGPVAQ
jgi:hypothetical protein